MLTRRSFGHGLALTAVMVALSTAASAADYNWKWQTFWQPGTVNQQAFERFAADVAERSDGRIEIEALPVNAVVPPGEMLDAVAANIIQGMNGGTGYFVDGFTFQSQGCNESSDLSVDRVPGHDLFHGSRHFIF